MIKLQFPVVIALALLVGGCAQPPLGNTLSLAAAAQRYGVSQQLLLTAASAGYAPTTRRGKTLFCSTQSQSFSYIPKTKCFDPVQMNLLLHQQSAGVRSVQRRASIEFQSAPSPPGI